MASDIEYDAGSFIKEDTDGSGTSDADDSSSDSEIETELETDYYLPAGSKGQPCRYYNNGHCRYGNKCRYLHICKYALRGNCQKGAACHLKHPTRWASSSISHMTAVPNESNEAVTLNDGRYYQWQLDDGHGWMDIEHDHIIEAHYCLPHTNGINIFNTPKGVVKIDFNKMRVLEKHIQVRRLDDGKSVWQWYCKLHSQFVKYGEKDSKGNISPVLSSDIEKRFQSNPNSSFAFTLASGSFEIRLNEMKQVSAVKKRRVVRRPQYREYQPLAASFQSMSLGANIPAQSPLWQFEGNSGKWYNFHQRSGTQSQCSISSVDIENMYQQNPNGAMDFTVSGVPYILDLKAMKQTNQASRHARNIRRVLS